MRSSLHLLAALALACAFVASALGIGASPARAGHADGDMRPTCSANSTADTSLRDMLALGRFASCEGTEWDGAAPVSWLYFDAASWHENESPQVFYTRISRYSSMQITALDANGAGRTLRFAADSGDPVAAGPVFTLPLPEVTGATQAVVVRIEGVHRPAMLTEAHLSLSANVEYWNLGQIALLAAISGLLLTPLVFNLNLFLILREKFALLHAMMIVSMIGYVLTSSGLAPMVLDLSMRSVAIGAYLTWTVCVAISAFFLVMFLEKGTISRRMRGLMHAMGWWSLIVSGFFGLQLSVTHSFDNLAYFLSFIPVAIVYTACLGQALWRGSKSARFVMFAWVPLIVAGVERLLRGVGVYTGPQALDQLFLIALGLEVVIVTLGIADRFVAVRRERDRAVAKANLLSELSERDPLTGLMNRRAIDLRFGELRAKGYETLAVFDLDKFKLINDRHGHDVGDLVLKTVAQVLESDPDALAVRMGGEEFVLMVRGADVESRIERMRQMIPVKVAREVEKLDTVVTSSAGMVTARHGALADLTFALLYRHADQLLYEAKNSGRNRLVATDLSPVEESVGLPALAVR